MSKAFDGTYNHEIGIAEHGCYPVGVIPETVGEFTGLTDKNGNYVTIKDGVAEEVLR